MLLSARNWATKEAEWRTLIVKRKKCHRKTNKGNYESTEPITADQIVQTCKHETKAKNWMRKKKQPCKDSRRAVDSCSAWNPAAAPPGVTDLASLKAALLFTGGTEGWCAREAGDCAAAAAAASSKTLAILSGSGTPVKSEHKNNTLTTLIFTAN